MRRSAIALLVLGGVVIATRLTGDPEPVVPVVSEQAHRLAKSSILIDGHNDVAHWISSYGFDLGMDGGDPDKVDAQWLWVFGNLFGTPKGEQLRTQTDLERMAAGGMGAQFFSIFVDPIGVAPEDAQARAFQIIDTMDAQFEAHRGRMEHACTPADIQRAFSRGRIAGLYGLEGGHALKDVSSAAFYFEKGVRYVTLAWSTSNKWAGSSGDTVKPRGLTEDGRALVRQLNQIGMMIDVSHASDETFWDVIQETSSPIIASHSSTRSLVSTPRNLSDDMLRAVAESGGIVMVNFGGIAIDPGKSSKPALIWDLFRHWGFSKPSIDMVIDHIAHIVKVAGVEHVGLGSDFDGTLFLPAGLEDVSGYPRLIQGLLDAGFTETDIRKVLGENFMRVMDVVLDRSAVPVADCNA
jgi:membrane dipeptidase